MNIYLITYRKNFLKATEKGRAVEWIDRIENIVSQFDLPRSHVNWNGSPLNVVHDIAKFNSTHPEEFQKLYSFLEMKVNEL